MPTNGRFSAMHLSPLGKISIAVSRDYACLMTPNKDETGRGLSWILMLMVVWLSSLFITNGAKHLNVVDHGRNEYWLKLNTGNV